MRDLLEMSNDEPTTVKETSFPLEFSICQMAALTGFCRNAVSRAVEHLPHRKLRGAKYYERKEALGSVYRALGEATYRATDAERSRQPDAPPDASDEERLSMNEARRLGEIQKYLKQKIEVETLKGERIPLETVRRVTEEMVGAIKDAIQSSPLDADAKNVVEAELRRAAQRLGA